MSLFFSVPPLPLFSSSSHRSVLLSIVTVEAPGLPRHISSTQLDGIVNFVVLTHKAVFMLASPQFSGGSFNADQPYFHEYRTQQLNMYRNVSHTYPDMTCPSNRGCIALHHPFMIQQTSDGDTFLGIHLLCHQQKSFIYRLPLLSVQKLQISIDKITTNLN